MAGDPLLDTSGIKSWKSIVTLIVFILTNLTALFPYYVPVFIYRPLWNALLDALIFLRVISPSQDHRQYGRNRRFKWFMFPMNFVTGPLIADLFLLAITAIGKNEVKGGTSGANNIVPIDIMAFFLSLAYIAISIDASGLVRWLAFKVLQSGGDNGPLLFFYLYTFFFALTSCIGNDPVILSGTAFLAYMTRVSSNIVHPRAWIHTQFAVANIGSAILVSSNPTNLVLAGAFKIKFVTYTLNMIVPVVITAIVLFPFLLWIVFADPKLIPRKIDMHSLPEGAEDKPIVNPNIPHARGTAEEEEKDLANNEEGKLLSLVEIMRPFLDKRGAAFGAIIMAATLITLLVLNFYSSNSQKHYFVYWVTLPAAVVLFFWDLGFGWKNRKKTRDIANRGQKEINDARAERAERANREAEDARQLAAEQENKEAMASSESIQTERSSPEAQQKRRSGGTGDDSAVTNADDDLVLAAEETGPKTRQSTTSSGEVDEKQVEKTNLQELPPRKTLVSLVAEAYSWSQKTFPTATAVMTHLPYALVPFALSMFVLVQALVTKGWVPVFAFGWDHWVTKTGTIGAIGGMAFLSVILCNFAGTNIGTTILLSRVIQSWQAIHSDNNIPISDRTFWGTVYAMALGVNYGAFSAAFSASLAGLLWRDILARKHIKVRALDFARVNLPIIAIAMTVGCVVLVAEVYIFRHTTPYKGGS